MRHEHGTIFANRVPSVAVAAIAMASTLGLVAGVAQQSEAPARSAEVRPTDGSFDRNEHRRHLALIQDRADGFEVAETARFRRLNTPMSDPVDLTGFDKAERARQHRLAPK